MYKIYLLRIYENINLIYIKIVKKIMFKELYFIIFFSLCFYQFMI